MISLRGLNLKINAYNHTWRLNWMDDWRDGVLLVGATCISFDTLGEAGQILFATRNGRQLKIIGQWGSGKLYGIYLAEMIRRQLNA